MQQAVAELGIEAEIAKVEDLTKIMEYNVMRLPALVIDGKIIAKGAMSVQEVKAALTER